MVHRLSCSKACGIFLDQGSNSHHLHWEADSLPLSPQGSPHRHHLIGPFMSTASMYAVLRTQDTHIKSQQHDRQGHGQTSSVVRAGNRADGFSRDLGTLGLLLSSSRASKPCTTLPVILLGPRQTREECLQWSLQSGFTLQLWGPQCCSG